CHRKNYRYYPCRVDFQRQKCRLWCQSGRSPLSFCILDWDFTHSLQDEHGECRNQEQAYEKCSHLQNSHRRVVSTDKSLLVKLDDCIWYHNQDHSKDDKGDAFTNTIWGILPPQQLQECGACCSTSAINRYDPILLSSISMRWNIWLNAY